MENASLDLKSEREKRNISLDKIAAETRISLRYLQSIEEGRFKDLPGGVYNRAFIKAYCESLNLDPEQVLKQYDALQTAPSQEKRPQTIIPSSEPDTFSRKVSVIVWVLILVAAISGTYLGRGWIAETFSSYFSQKKAEEIPVTVENPQAVKSPRTEADLQVSVPSADALSEKPAFQDIPPQVTENAVGDQTTLETPPLSLAVPEEIKPSRATIRLELSAIESCWISATIDNAPSLAKTLRPGETELLFADKSARIRIGNAGGIRVKINDVPTKPLGRTGEIITMDINPDNTKQFTE